MLNRNPILYMMWYASLYLAGSFRHRESRKGSRLSILQKVAKCYRFTLVSHYPESCTRGEKDGQALKSLKWRLNIIDIVIAGGKGQTELLCSGVQS